MEKDFQKLQVQQIGTAPKVKAAKSTSAGALVNSQHSGDSEEKLEGTGQKAMAERGSQKQNAKKKKKNSAKATNPCVYCKSPDQTSNSSTSPEEAQAENSPQKVYVFTAFTLCETVIPPSSEGWKDDPCVLSGFPLSVQRKLRVNGMLVSGLISTGSCHTRLHSRFICPAQYLEGESITLQSPFGDSVTLPRAMVTIELDGKAIPMKVAVCEDLPIGCVMGRDMLPWIGIISY